MNKQRAFSITELMITVAVLGILAAIALPSLRHALINNRITSKTNQFVSVLNYARSEAIIGRQIRITPQEPDQNSGAKRTNNNEWGFGWIIWDDANDNGVLDCSTDWAVNCEKLREYKYQDDIRVDGPDDLTQIAYDSRGRLTGAAQQKNMAFVFCLNDATNKDPFGREITIQMTGRTMLTHREYPCATP